MPSQPPEAYFTLYLRQSGSDVVPPPAGAPIAARTATTATQARPKETLISCYGLESRLSGADSMPSPQQDAGGCAVWEDTAEKLILSLFVSAGSCERTQKCRFHVFSMAFK
jgi:hypothetical protein